MRPVLEALALVTPVEYAVILTLVAVAAVHQALAVRCAPSKVPWLDTLRRPAFYGGWAGVAKHAGLVFAWTVGSLVLVTAWCVGLRRSEELVQIVYDQLGASGEADAGFATLLATSLFAYLVFVRRVRSLAIAYLEHIPRPDLQRPKEGGENQPPKKVFEAAVVPKLVQKNPGDGKPPNRITSLLKILAYAVPEMFVPTYTSLYHRTNGVVLRGAAYSLLQDFNLANQNGMEVIARFFNAMLAENPNDARLHAVNKCVQDCAPGSPEHACTCLIGLIRTWGYPVTRNALEQYLQLHAGLRPGPSAPQPQAPEPEQTAASPEQLDALSAPVEAELRVDDEVLLGNITKCAATYDVFAMLTARGVDVDKSVAISVGKGEEVRATVSGKQAWPGRPELDLVFLEVVSRGDQHRLRQALQKSGN